MPSAAAAARWLSPTRARQRAMGVSGATWRVADVLSTAILDCGLCDQVIHVGVSCATRRQMCAIPLHDQPGDDILRCVAEHAHVQAGRLADPLAWLPSERHAAVGLALVLQVGERDILGARDEV